MNIKISTLIYLLLISLSSYSQVGINTESPNTLTALDVENLTDGSAITPLGIMIPRMTKAQRDEINVSDTDLAQSLMIYNTDEDCYNYFSKDEGEWKSLCGSLGKAELTIDCSSLEAEGKYASDTELTSSNFISMKVTVTKAGNYNITGITDNSNGYYFSSTGQFLEAGVYTIYVPGMGIPVTPTATGATGDKILISNNGLQICDNLLIPVTDSRIKPEYTINCNTITINGNYIAGTALTAANTIGLTITANTTAAGAPYEITTSTVNGYSFSGSGTLAAGSQTITLAAQGTPITNGSNVFTLETNSEIVGGATCDVTVKVAARKMRILGGGENDSSNTYNIGLSNTWINRAMLNDNYFGPGQNAVYPVNGFEFYAATTAAALITDINTYNPDIVVVQYDVYETASSNQQVLAEFVENGGVLIFCSDGGAANSARNQAAQALTRLIFNNDNITVNTTDNTDVWVMQDTESLITSGPFMNLVGKQLARDAAGNFTFSVANFPFESAKIIAFGTANNLTIRSFMHATKGFFMYCDGAPFAGTVNSTAGYNWPAKFTQTNGVVSAAINNYSTPATFNSYLFLNTMAWAIDYAQKHKTDPSL